MDEYVTLAEAGKILTERGMPMDLVWLRRKAAAGQIPGAENVGKKIWLVPRVWAQTYVKVKSGRPRKDKKKLREASGGSF